MLVRFATPARPKGARNAGNRRRKVAPALLASAITAAMMSAVIPGQAVAAQPVPGHSGLVPAVPRTDTPRITNGEIFDIEVIGNRVFVAGSFTSVGNVAQAGLASYDMNTGQLDTQFRPTFGGGGVNAVEASPDGSALYVAGSFDTVNGVSKPKVARLNLTTGAPLAGFTISANNLANALAVSNSTVYVGGKFTRINGLDRSGLVALDRTTGAVDTGFDLPITGGIGVAGVLTVQQLKLTHDDTRLLVVHTGRQIDDENRYGVGMIDTATKSLLPWRTRLWEDNLNLVGGIQRVYGGDISPDDSYFVVTSGSGGDRPPINDTAIAFPVAGGDDMQPLWISRHFDSVYSVAVTEHAVYIGGHFGFQESPTANDPWPGLDNVGYGTGQGLGGYGLGDQVVRRDHLGALDPQTGKALEWNPGSNSFEGNKAMKATARGLIVGGDGNIQGGKSVGRVAFYDLATVPAASATDTAISAPIEGRVIPANQGFTIDGTATATSRVSRVQVEVQDRDTKQFLQDDLATWGAPNNVWATLGSTNATSTTWSLTLPAGISGTRSLFVKAKAIGNVENDPSKAVKKFETFSFDDQAPTTGISSPAGGLLTTTAFRVTGTASDDRGVNALSYWFRDSNNHYLQADGTVAAGFNSFRGEPDVVGATAATWQYDVTLPHEGEWRMSATAIDNAGQSDLRGAVRDWNVTSTGVRPQVQMTAPATINPPIAGPVLNIAPGSPITFSGTASDDVRLKNVEITLRNNTTGERLAADGTWGVDAVAGLMRISPLDINAATYNWSYTTPFALTPGQYNFTVRATDNVELATSLSWNASTTTGLTVQVPGDQFPNGLLDAGGTPNGSGFYQDVEALHLDLSGTATDDLGVAGVQIALRDIDTNRYLQSNGTMTGSFATLSANLASPGATSTTFALPVDLPTQGEWAVTAWAVDTAGQMDISTVGATARYLVYPGDLDPYLSETLSQPTEATAFTESQIFVSGRAFDDVALAQVQVAVVNGLGQYMSATGTFTSTTESWRGAFLNSPGTPGSNYSFTTPAIPDGSYAVRVRAVDLYGQIQPVPKQVQVSVSAPAGNQAPVAAASVSCSENVCAFDGRGSSDESASTLTYAWNFGNGRTGTGSVPSHTYLTAGTFTPTLVVRDQYGVVSATHTMSPITIVEPSTNRAPSAVIVSSCTGLTCTVNGTTSTDPDTGFTLTYAWSFSDGTTATGSQVSKAFAGPGTYSVSLTVTDNWGRVGSTATGSLTVA